MQLEISDSNLYLICFKFPKASNPAGCGQTLTSLINWQCFQFTDHLLHFIMVLVTIAFASLVYSALIFSPVNKKKKCIFLF